MEYKIRQATREDIPKALELVHEFQKESLETFGVFCDDDTMAELMPKLVETTLVLEIDGVLRGLLAGAIGTHMLNKKPVFQEIMWYVSKKYRRYGIKLFRELEKWCLEKGIDQIVMVCLGNRTEQALDKLYKSFDYKVLETHYLKQLRPGG